MKRITSTLTALALTVLLAVPALAGGNQQAGMVTKTFELTIHGEVDNPEDRLFAVTYFYSPDLAPAELGKLLIELYTSEQPVQPPKSLVQAIGGFCGPEGYQEQITEGLGMEVTPANADKCEGGKTYTVQLEVPQGTSIHYSLDTALVSDLENSEGFGGSHKGDPMDLPTVEDFEVIDADQVNSATYSFEAKGGEAPNMPETGAGGMAADALPVGRAAAAASALVIGSLVWRQRR